MSKQAVKCSTDCSCALVIEKLSNRMSYGDLDGVTSRAFSMMRSVALWKHKSQTSVRTIGIGGALKRIIVKTHSFRNRGESSTWNDER